MVVIIIGHRLPSLKACLPRISVIMHTGGETVVPKYGTAAFPAATAEVVMLATRLKASLLPSIEEVLLVGNKPMQYRLVEGGGLSVVPYEVIETKEALGDKLCWQRAKESLAERLRQPGYELLLAQVGGVAHAVCIMLESTSR